MALVNCPECGREKLSDKVEHCPVCGYPVREHFIYEYNVIKKQGRIKAEENKKQKQKELFNKIKQSKLLKVFKGLLVVFAVLVMVCGVVVGYYNVIYLPQLREAVCEAAEAYIAGAEAEEVIEQVEDKIKFSDSSLRYEEAKDLVRKETMNFAESYIQSQDYEVAYDLLGSIKNDFGKTSELVARRAYVNAMRSYEIENYETAIKIFENVNYTGEEYLEACYQYGYYFLNRADSVWDYKWAAQNFEKAAKYNYKDSAELLKKVQANIK